MKLLSKAPYWVKSGLITAFVITAVMIAIPEKFGNMAYTPWYLGWLVLPAFIIFSFLCIVFGVDFVSNFAHGEGPRRLILLVLFNVISYFIVAFCAGALAAIIVRGGKNIWKSKFRGQARAVK